MKGDITLAILKIIQSAGNTTGDILDTLTYFGYVESYRRIRGLSSKIQARKPILEKTVLKMEERQRISKLLYKLRKEGLIIKGEVSNNPDAWDITPKGVRKLEALIFDKEPRYKAEQSKELKIIIFDIPEIKRKKRDWLRRALKDLKFEMLQKSVWIGRAVIPEDFFKDLNNSGLLEYVEIFAITKGGSLKQIQ